MAQIDILDSILPETKPGPVCHGNSYQGLDYICVRIVYSEGDLPWMTIHLVQTWN